MLKYICFVGLIIFSVVTIGYNSLHFNSRDVSLGSLDGEKSVYSQVVQLETKEIFSLLDQKFTWLGEGNQSFAFENPDKTIVLKFFKMNIFKEDDVKKKRIFTGYETAYQYDKKNSGLLFVHLNQTSKIFPTVHVKDRLGFSHEIDVNNTAFILQQKTIVTKELLKKIFANKDLALAQVRISNLLDMIIEGYKKGILDNDHNILINTGFVGEVPIRFDVGKLVQSEEIKNPEIYHRDLEKLVNNRVLYWVKKYYPQYHDEMAVYLHNKYLN